MKLIDDIRDDWRVATRWASVRLSLLGAVLTGAWESLPASVQAKMPYAEYLVPLMFVLVIFARVTTLNGQAPSDGA